MSMSVTEGIDGEAPAAESRVRWLTDESEVLEEAKNTGKQILVDFLDPE
jgi:hypothetical protein